jgi:iron complex outermembrane recepter protein
MKRSLLTSVPATVSVVLAMTLGASSAYAQAQTQTAQGTADVGALQEVVVTAQFRSQSVQDTPLAITAVNAESLAERGQTSLIDITQDAPSVQLSSTATAFGPSMSAYIRGIGQGDLDPALEPGVGIYIDDVYFGTLTGSLMDLLDLDRVEVLRGPQGTLEGMNSEGGAIKLFSKQPDANESMTFDALYGSRNHVELRASTNFAITDNLFVRISGVGNHQDGYEQIKDFGCANPSFTATDTAGVTGLYSVAAGPLNSDSSCVTGHEGGIGYAGGRVALRWVVNDALEVNAIGDITNEDQEVNAETLIYAGPDPLAGNASAAAAENITIPATNGGLLPFDQGKVPAIIPNNYYTTYATFCMPAVTNPVTVPGLGSSANNPAICSQPRQTINSWGGQLGVNWTIEPDMTLKNILAERGYTSSWSEDNDASPWPLGLGIEGMSHHQFSDELRLSGRVSSIDYTVGAFYFRELTTYYAHEDLWYTFPTLPGIFNFIQDDPVLAHDKAGYLHLTWHATSKLDAIFGARYTSQDKTYNYVRLNPQGGTGGSATLVGSLNDTSGYYSGSREDWRGDLDYHLTDNMMVYVQYSTGFKGGGVDPRPFYVAQAVQFQPETLTTYESGLKTSWFDNHLHANIDAYFSQYRDIQLTLNNCSNVPSILAASTAAGFNYGIPCALPFNAGAAHQKGVEFETQAKFGGLQIDGNVSYLDFAYTSLSPFTGITYGMVTPFTPEWQGAAGAQYTVPFGAAGAATARLDANFRTQIQANAVNSPNSTLGGYTVYNARVSWEPNNAKWQLALLVKNLTDKHYWLNKFDLAQTGGASIAADPSPPLEVDVEIKHTM